MRNMQFSVDEDSRVGQQVHADRRSDTDRGMLLLLSYRYLEWALAESLQKGLQSNCRTHTFCFRRSKVFSFHRHRSF